jgi:hypothetical protein
MRPPSRNRMWMRRRYTRLLGIGDHWYRSPGGPDDTPPDSTGRCAFNDCTRPRHEHWLEVGEWAVPRRVRWQRIAYRAQLRLRGL